MHPYSNLPNQCFWNRFVAPTPWRDLPLNDEPKFRLRKSDKIATAGSCFAQHISRYLRNAGHTPYIAENAHPLVVELGGNTDSYQTFSARYGNIYTTRQAWELFQQAFGLIPVVDDYVEKEGRIYDLMRPNAVPGGFANLKEARADRIYHLQCVKEMFQTTDAFVFTLGLTECWFNADAGHTYSSCPGTVHGEFIPGTHIFQNLTFAQVAADLDALLQSLLNVNAAIKLILTVSPVPLVATNTNKNVLVASSYSKSVLRAVCGEIEMRYANVQYFPSYEIISHPASFGQYLDSDLRGVVERGVSHVMDVFLSTIFDTHSHSQSDAGVPAAHTMDEVAQKTASFLEVECEEILNEAP
jgi:hypothetical protein